MKKERCVSGAAGISCLLSRGLLWTDQFQECMGD